MARISRSILVLAFALTVVLPGIVSYWPHLDRIVQAGGGAPVTPPVSPGPSASPTPTPVPVSGPVPPATSSNSQSSSSGSSSPASGGGAPKTCTENAPAAPHIFEIKRVSGSTVKLAWTASELATDYTISYGTKSGEYIYGVPNTSNQTNFTITYLDPNKKYFFRVFALRGCAPSSPSNEVSTQSQAATNAPIKTNEEMVLGATTLEEVKDASPSATPSPTPVASPSSVPQATVQDEASQNSSMFWVLGISLLLFILLVLYRVYRSSTK